MSYGTTLSLRDYEKHEREGNRVCLTCVRQLGTMVWYPPEVNECVACGTSTLADVALATKTSIEVQTGPGRLLPKLWGGLAASAPPKVEPIFVHIAFDADANTLRVWTDSMSNHYPTELARKLMSVCDSMQEAILTWRYVVLNGRAFDDDTMKELQAFVRELCEAATRETGVRFALSGDIS